MSQVIADFQQRQQALDPTNSYIVQAPAGSGKTELISQRFLALLANCEQPEAVLAITFTRKAAGEMRQRIVDALHAAAGPAPEQDHLRQTWQLAHRVMEQDARLQWQLLANPNRLQVVTIDSFNARLARQMPLLARLGVQASPVEKPDALYREAARRTLQEVETGQWQDDLSVLMLHLGNQVERIQDLLVSMLARRDQWLRHLTGDAGRQVDREVLEAALTRLVEEHLQRLQEALSNDQPAGLLAELCQIAEQVSPLVDAAKKPELAGWQQPPATGQPTATPDALSYWQGLAELLLTGSNGLRKTVNNSIGILPPSKEKDPERKAVLQQRKTRLLELIAKVGGDEELLELFVGLRQLPSLRYSDEQWRLLQALGRVLLLSAAQLQLVFGENGQVDFAEISQSAMYALGEEGQPTDLAMILDYRLQHILVDEFQDTSHGQFRLLEQLTQGWQPGDGKTLFLVGDPMQSIYRFREAEVGLFLRARQQGIGNLQLLPLTLQVNFRSQQAIVDWVNQGLATAFARREDISTGAVSYSPSVPFHVDGEQAGLKLHATLAGNAVDEAQQVVNVIQAELANHPTSKIAVLVRSRRQLDQIIPALQQAQILFEGVDLAPLQDLPVIIDLYTLTRALLHPADRLHWLALLRAPWCGLSLDDLLKFDDNSVLLPWQQCQDPVFVNTLSDHGRQRVDKLVARIAPFISGLGRFTLKQLVSRCWQTLGGNAIYPSTNEQLAVQRYFDLLETHDQGGRLADLRQFDEALEQLYAAPDNRADGRVQLMTIHKSKGLEFDCVLLPGLGRRGMSDQPGLLEWLERPTRDGQIDLLLSPIKASKEEHNDPISASLQAINRHKARHELTRLLYVALTRAKSRLHLFADARVDSKGKPQPPGGSLLTILWPAIADAFDDIEPAAAVTSSESQLHQPLLSRLPLDWQPEIPGPLPVTQPTVDSDLLAAGQAVEFDWASETARHIGTLTHRYLQQLSDSDGALPTSQAIRAGLVNLGVNSEQLELAVNRVTLALQQTRADRRGQWLLENRPDAYSEYDLTYHDGNRFKRVILDRTFVDEQGHRWIVDYKTGGHQGADLQAFLDREQERYRPQLENYARLMQQLDDRPIRLGLYFPMLQGWREWEFPTPDNLPGNPMDQPID